MFNKVIFRSIYSCFLVVDVDFTCQKTSNLFHSYLVNVPYELLIDLVSKGYIPKMLEYNKDSVSRLIGYSSINIQFLLM